MKKTVKILLAGILVCTSLEVRATNFFFQAPNPSTTSNTSSAATYDAAQIFANSKDPQILEQLKRRLTLDNDTQSHTLFMKKLTDGALLTAIAVGAVMFIVAVIKDAKKQTKRKHLTAQLSHAVLRHDAD